MKMKSDAEKGLSTPEDFGYREFQITDKELGAFRFYLYTKTYDRRKPTFIYLEGSGAYPLFFKFATSEGYHSIVFLHRKFVLNRYNLVLIGKPDVPFFKIISKDKKGNPTIKHSVKYNTLLSLDYRVKTASKAINFLLSHDYINKKNIAVWGASEGAQVAPRVALLNKNVTHLLCFCGNGLNQFYDFIIEVRRHIEKGLISHKKGQSKIDHLFKVFQKMYAQPKVTRKYWRGHTYLRWASFCREIPLESYLKLDIPIYLAVGTADIHIFGTDYACLEFLRKHRTNLDYKVYPGFDHGFNEVIFKKGKPVKIIIHPDKFVHDALRWFSRHRIK